MAQPVMIVEGGGTCRRGVVSGAQDAAVTFAHGQQARSIFYKAWRHIDVRAMFGGTLMRCWRHEVRLHHITYRQARSSAYVGHVSLSGCGCVHWKPARTDIFAETCFAFQDPDVFASVEHTVCFLDVIQGMFNPARPGDAVILSAGILGVWQQQKAY
ncbi:hypothetical protein L1887_49544 [Cichorium endivia]|nr:hypothetical protein L1887_49544 [Cichorium endivia]